MGTEQQKPQMKIDLGHLLAAFQAKLIDHEAINLALIDYITTHDFSKGNPSRDEVKAAIHVKIEGLTKKAVEAVTKSKIIVPSQNSNIITTK